MGAEKVHCRLRRTFLLIDSEHGLKSSDVALLRDLASRGISHQVILSKVDKILFPHSRLPSPQRLSANLLQLRSICEEIRLKLQPEDGRMSRTLGDVLCCSAEKEIQAVGVGRGKLGIDAVRWAVLSGTGLDCDEHGERRRFEGFAAAAEEEVD